LDVSYYLETGAGLRINVRVQPRASRNKIDGVVEDQLRIRLTAPPVENAANTACLEMLAALFGVPKSRVHQLGGMKSREKVFHVDGQASELVEILRREVETP
jgi:hypothetical protein